MNYEDLQLIYRLIEENGTLKEVSNFLERRGLTYSASSWEHMIEDRLEPAYEDGELDSVDLLDLLAELEEHGHQHTFLYRCSPEYAGEVMDREHVTEAAERLGVENVLRIPRIVDKPDEATVTEIRWEESPHSDRALVVKIVEKRIRKERLGREEGSEDEEGIYRIAIRNIPIRAVDVFRLHDSGLLELRIHSQESSTRYEKELELLWGIISRELVDREEFERVSLSTAKRNLWENRERLGHLVRYSDSRFRDAEGNTVQAATGRKEASLADDEAVNRSLDEFNKADTHCDRANVWWLEQEDGPPSKNVRSLLDGHPHEFAITARCRAEDYEHVLGKLLEFN